MELRPFIEPQQGATYAEQLAVALRAQECGFPAIFRSDHLLAMGEGDGMPGPTDTWTTLAGLARDTTTIRLGTLVTSATFRHPGMLAVQVAQVDEMSGGRVELGLGAGWFEEEHAAYGIPFPTSVGERFDRLEEQLAGRYVTVIVGGKGRRRTPALAARYAGEFNAPFVSVEESATLFATVGSVAERSGRDPASLTLSNALVVCAGKDERQVRARAAAIGRDPDELRSNGLAGTPAQIVDRIGSYAEAGSQRIYLQLLDLADLEHLDLIAGEVVPQLA